MKLYRSGGEALVFDLDGTLTDPSEGISNCLRHALQHVGAPIPGPAALSLCIGPPLPAVFAGLLPDAADVPRAVEAFRDLYGETGLFENCIYPGIAAALRRMSRSSLFVATSKPRVYAVRIVEHLSLAPLFQGIYGSELTGERGDKTELLAHLLAEEQLAPEDVVMIGDRKHDILAARALGIESVGVTWGFGSEEELRSAGAGTLCRTVDELIAWYERRL